MKNTNRKMTKKNKLAAMLAAVMVATTVSSIGASAQTVPAPAKAAVTATECAVQQNASFTDLIKNWRNMKPGEKIRDPRNGVMGDKEYWRRQYITRTYGWRVHNMERMRGVKKKVSIKNSSFFYAQKMKLYGRKVLDVDENGNFVLGKWEQISPDSASTCHGFNTKTFEIDGDYFAFAFTVDAMWGTDFPFSKIFLDNNVNSKYLDYVDWSDMNIKLTGSCRCVCINIKLNGVQIVNEEECDAHSEWKP
ncbi:MAG: hypothetical protein ILA24_01665 [Ruminococcus sp.]|nr:hypothetical protein [Ruminococcus sp.]